MSEPGDVVIKEEVHNCNLCPDLTNSFFSMRNHVSQHRLPRKLFNCAENTLEMYHCKECDFKTDLLVFFKKHAQQIHLTTSKNGDESQSVQYTLQSFICRNCPFETYSSLHWLHHFKIKCSSAEEMQREEADDEDTRVTRPNSENLFECHHCAYKTNHKGNLRRHNITQHLTSEEIQWFQCDKCSFKTRSKKCLKSHNNAHLTSEETRRFSCDKCSFKTKTKAILKNHNIRLHLAHEEIEWFQCDKCSYKAKMREDLVAHKTLHSDWTGFQCDKCSFKTKKKKYLKNHNIRLHVAPEEIKWFQCDKCSYKAKMRKDLVAHKTVHSEWAGFQCDKCSFKTKTKNSLKSHNIRLHVAPEEIEWFQCDKCSYKAKMRKDLVTHKTHNHS